MNKLIRRARSGDDEAFAELLREQEENLWRVAVSVMRNDSLAADALQETAIKAWRSMPSFSGKSKFSTWITRILLNTCFDELKRQKNNIAVGEDALESSTPPSPDPADKIHASIDVKNILDRLSSQDRAILSLFYMNDLPIKEIAQILDVSDGNARTRLSRARSRFKSLYMNERPASRLDNQSRKVKTISEIHEDSIKYFDANPTSIKFAEVI